jgi:hypothetical protein
VHVPIHFNGPRISFYEKKETGENLLRRSFAVAIRIVS